MLDGTKFGIRTNESSDFEGRGVGDGRIVGIHSKLVSGFGTETTLIRARETAQRDGTAVLRAATTVGRWRRRMLRRTLEFGIVGQIVSATGCRSRVLRALSAAGEVNHCEVLATKVGRRVGDIRARRPSGRVHGGILKRKLKRGRRERRRGTE